jgi:hypothetical protein
MNVTKQIVSKNNPSQYWAIVRKFKDVRPISFDCSRSADDRAARAIEFWGNGSTCKKSHADICPSFAQIDDQTLRIATAFGASGSGKNGDLDRNLKRCARFQYGFDPRATI